MALGALFRLWRLKRAGRLDVIDAHFAYPDGYAAGLLGKWLDVPVTVTLRGSESRQMGDLRIRPLLRRGLDRVSKVFTVSESLRQVALSLGVSAPRTMVVGNGIDLKRFYPLPRDECRRALNLPRNATVLITVGGLVERKGFHRVMACLTELRNEFPELHYLVVGGPSIEGDWSERLLALRRDLGLADCVHFLGPKPPDELRVLLSAADVFVLSTRNEGWANVLLEAMACGLPVVTTDVGGNREVVSEPELGTVLPFDNHEQLRDGIARALRAPWDRASIRRYAEANTWDRRVDVLVSEIVKVHEQASLSGVAE